MAEFLRMSNPIQHYAWGSRSVLAEMQGRPGPTEQPEAELWMGAHPSAPSRVQLAGRQCGLDEVAPRLPFLLKVLAIDAPLSLQVHPASDQAREGFEREDAAGVAPDAPHRNYKDDRAKPETVVALTDMWLLAGQQERDRLTELAAQLGLPWLGAAAAAPFPVRHALELPDDVAAAAVRACVAAAGPGHDTAASAQEGTVSLTPAMDPLERARCLIRLLSHHYPDDRGLLVALCMNVVHLEPGQALFTPARQLHAYLSGTAVEIMGCSDNVLRAGLTSKHVDVPELLRIMAVPQEPVVLLETRETADGAVRYPLWDPALSLTAARVTPERPVVRESSGTCMVLVTQGAVTASDHSAGTDDPDTVTPPGAVGAGNPGGAAASSGARRGGTRATAGESLIRLDGPGTVTVRGEGQIFLVEAVPPGHA
ncbi:mannose-6-phosphate isomerase, class I [Kocuria tytonis]|nr:mannose-6-phosphate isomerase, class I [Kocuria tytonis]